MRVLGIDPGMKNTGIAVLDLLPGDIAEFVASTTVVDLSTARTFHAVSDFLIKHEVEEIAMLVFQTSLRSRDGRPVVWASSSLTQRTIGAMEVLASLSRLNLAYYDETEVKEGLGGSKTASKDKVATYVKLAMGWKESPPATTHEMDAVAACLYHQRMLGFGRKLTGG